MKVLVPFAVLLLLAGAAWWLAPGAEPAPEPLGTPGLPVPSGSAVETELERPSREPAATATPGGLRAPAPAAVEDRTFASALPPMADVTSGAASGSVQDAGATESRLFAAKYVSHGRQERAEALLAIQDRLLTGSGGGSDPAQALTPEQAAWLRREAAWLEAHPGR